jgi:diguanylate cyclase (GGDEF)-like protein/PAS domain S-box-containing protein
MALKIPDIAPDRHNGDWDNDERWRSLIASGSYTNFSRHRRKDGSDYPVEINARVINYEGEVYACSVVRDISERLEAEKALRDSEEKFRLISDTSPVALIIHRKADGKILYVNAMAGTLFDLNADNIGEYTFSSLFNKSDSSLEFLQLLASSEQIYGHELLLKAQEEDSVWISINAKTILLQGEQVVCCALQDISEAHELSSQLSYQAAYDALTGLVNRREFEYRLQRVIRTAEQERSENAMCFLDLDQFKVINDTCGHIAGDELLRQVAQLLQNNIRKRDTLARLGGDEFAVLLEICSLDQAMRVANSIRETIQDYRFIWENNSFNIGVSIGLVPINCENENITEVMKRADAACYEAKEQGRNRVHVYHPGDEEISYRHGEMQWVARITSALEQNRLQLWAQKIIPIKETRRGEHYELLLRMIDSDGDIILPSIFLPAAERYNLISRLDRWVVATALTWFKKHPGKYRKLWLCSINLSGQSLGDEAFLNEITGYFNRLGIAPDRFCFEVTETAAIANLNHATRFIKSLAKLGCRFALDDFGSGLSSYAYLKNLPVDFIKIDGMFIKDLLVNPMHTALVKSINDVGHAMGKKTIAEYVENDAILEELEDMGVDYAQGFGIEKPVLLIDGATAELEQKSHSVNL